MTLGRSQSTQVYRRRRKSCTHRSLYKNGRDPFISTGLQHHLDRLSHIIVQPAPDKRLSYTRAGIWGCIPSLYSRILDVRVSSIGC
jgi:hypothetical protein